MIRMVWFIYCKLFKIIIIPLQVNTFQVALIYNNNVSFVFFFYDEINIDSRSVNIGFRSPNNNNGGESFMLPGVLSGSTELNLTSTGNTDIPGFFAYRVDLNFIVQPQGISRSSIF